MASARNKMSINEEIRIFDKEQLKGLIGTFELKDYQCLVNVSIKIIFEDLFGGLTYNQFNMKFAKGNENTILHFILNPSFIRYMLKKNKKLNQ